MTENDVANNKLKLFWDFFFKAETGTYEKSTWLDLFLAEFLVQLNNGAQAKNIIDFCPHSGVVTLVGCELLCSIHRVTSSINTLYAVPVTYANLEHGSIGQSSEGNHNNIQLNAPEAEETLGPFMSRTNQESSTEILQRYLLSGIAWKCLILLNTLGVEGLSCCRQLSSVLIWLLGELGSMQPVNLQNNTQTEQQNVYIPQIKEREPIHQLFSSKIWHQHKWNSNQVGKITSATEKMSLNTRHKRVSRLESTEDSSKRKANKENDKSSESCSSTDDLQVLNRSLAIKVWTASDDFEYFNSPRRSKDDVTEDSLYGDPFYIPKKIKPKAEDFLTEQHKEVIHSEINQFRFTLLVTDLLQELCKAESSLSGSEGSQISMQCINFALRNLCAFQFGSSPVSLSQYSLIEVAHVKAAFTELLMVALDKVLIRQDLCAKLINNGTLPMFLRLLEDTVFKVMSRINIREGHKQIEISLDNENEADNILKYIFGISYSLTAFFYSLLMQCRSVDKVREFMEQFKLYAECLKGGLLKECIGVMIRIPGTKKDKVFVLTKKILESIGRLVGGMKRVRSEVTHSAACPRSRHKACRARVTAGTHHHHDILGEGNTGPTLGAGCCISTMYGTLTSLLVDEVVSNHAVLRNKILHVMLNCGACCCVAPGPLMENIVRLMLTRNGVASLCLSVLEHTVYGELGASVLLPRATDQLPCAVCEPERSRFDVGARSPTFPMRDSHRNYVQGFSGIEKKSAWSFLIHYNSLLQLDNDNNVLHATVAHLLRVTPRCKLEMKYELLFSVIYPTFIVAKHRYIIRMEESAYFLTVSCLNIFASLLNTVSFAEQFIQKGGLSYVLELVSLSEFSNQCCSILEVAIVVEIFKLIKENPGEFSNFREMDSLASVQMLFKSLKEVTDKCYKIYKLKIPVEKFEELCDLSQERKILKLNIEDKTSERTLSRQLSSPRPVRSDYNAENTVEYLIEDYIEILKNVCTFWKTCSGLCLYSPMFREYIVNDPAFMDTYCLLKILFYYLCNSECTVAEMRVIIKILEVLLTIQFAVSDLTMNRCKEATIRLLRDAFLAESALCTQSSSLRAICEMLIRVATTCASADHVMPPLNKAKLPPLLCASMSSDLEHSSSEDSLAGPYASEHSEPYYYTADEGYEADVEVGKFEVTSSYKSRKFSPITYMDTGSSFEHSDYEEITVDYNEYTKSGAVNHPELCIIVVDILTQLIQKLITIQPHDESTNIDISKMGVGLARACCARLSAALARPLRSVAAMRSPDLNVIERLLSGPSAALLTTKCEQLEELQKSILDLVHVLAAQSVTPSELAAYLKLFKAAKPPLTVLLSSLSRLVDSAQPDMPDCILCFPIDRFSSSDVATQALSQDMDYVIVNSTASQSHQAESVARRLYEQHLQSGTISCWSRSALRCGVEGAGWGLWLQGFATALWLRVRGPDTKPDAPEKCEEDERSDWDIPDEWQSTPLQTDSTKKKTQRKESPTVQKSSDLVHVFSIGYDSLMFEVWMDTLNGLFTFKLTRPEPNTNKVLSETSVESNMPLQQWNCIAFNVKEIVHKRKIHIQVTLFVNGCECETVSLPLQGILIRKVMPTNVLVGDVSPPSRSPAWYLASMTLLRAPVLNTYNAMYLAAHGPNASVLGTKQVRCQSPNYPSLLTPNVLDSNVDWDQVYEMSSMNIRDLQDNLLLTFSAQSPTIMNLYHQTTSVPTVFSSRVGTTAGIMGSSSGSNLPGVGTMSTIPETLFVIWNGTPLPSQYRGLPPAAFMLGGPDVLLYLFARVVELDGSAEEQALALSILLRLCRSDNRLHSMFYEHDSLSMLHVVMASNKCCMTHHLLKTLLDEACNSPVLVNSSGRFFILTRSDAVVVEPKFLVFMIRAWRDLERPQEFGQWDASRHTDVQYPPSVWMYERTDARHEPGGGLLGTLLLALHVLLRDEHPRRAFNAYQMNRVNVLQHLLLACKERFLNSEYGAFSDTVACSLVELVRALLGSPPLLCHLALLVDFLVLMHQASDTFVTHSRANFYFLLTSETQASGEFNLLNFMSKKSSFRKTRKRSESITSLESAYAMRELSKSKSSQIGSSNSMDGRSQTNIDVKKELRQEQEKETEKSEGDTENVYEASKELKGLINMQIKTKQDKEPTGKHKSSSLSESSDLGPVESGDQMSVNEQTLINEYIVIDYDDLESTTVDMFSSGIYHQQTRVRAGGSPGWAACEGLLQLLHDIISVMPDTTLNQALGVVIQADTLLVLGNHREASVRAAVVRVVCALMRRCPPEEAKRLDSMSYCHHLADQIALYNASWELAAACAMLLTKRDAPLEDQLDDESWADVTEKSIIRSSPLLAILPCSINDVPLTHNITLAIKKIIDKGSLKMLNDVGVTEVVIKTIRAVGNLSDAAFEGRDLILDDLRSLLNRIAIKALMSQHNMQTITEIQYLLSFVEMSERERGKLAANANTAINAAEVVRDSQCVLFEAQLDHLEEKLHSAYSTQTSHANYFTAVISSAVSLSSEPAAWAGTSSHLPRSEFAARHRAVVLRAVQFVINRDPNADISRTEMALVERLFTILLDAVTGTTSHRTKWWVSMGADWTTPLHDLFYWLISPNARDERLKAAILRRVYLAPPTLHNVLTPADPSGQRKLAVYLLSTLKQIHASTTLLLELPITDWCRSWALATQAQLAARVHSDTLSDEATRLAVEDDEKRIKNVASIRSNIGKVVFSKDALASKLTETAMSITRQVVDIQNGERKAFMDHLRRSQSETVACTQRWQKLIDTYTHEQALWYDDASYPNSWELDPTEGPARIRVRLRRCHLNISKRFFKKEYKEKAERGSRPSPLSYLFTSPLSVVHSGLVARLHLNETVSYMSRVTYVTVASDRPGELLLSDRCIHFVPEDADPEEDKRENEESAKICEVESRAGSGCSMHAASALSWPLDLVTSVVTRRWCLQEHAVELFLSTGHAHLVAFQDIQDRNAFLKALNNCHLPNRSEAETLTEAMTLWRNGNITNWEYLMKLNGLAGRSYNDLMQYPVLPFVLADYTSRILDLSAPSSFRDLSKPMAVQNKNREIHYINTYNDLKQARREGTSPLLNREPHHYASLYSNSGAVLHYLVRLPPFTPLFLNYQDNNFDMPDRTFHSLQTTWRLITKDSPTDVKELIPEFFYLPEFLKNNEGLNLGVRQCGAAVDDVELPPWAPDARLFVLIHRQALESAIVTESLPHWIDLVFGYKQTGQAALDAINVFPACTYYGFDPTALEDEVERTAAQAQVRTYGQTPRQLLRHPHPHHTTDLAPRDTASVWAGVENGRWGVYCGSPSQSAPTVLTSRACGCAARLNALPSPRAVAVGARGSIVIALPQQHQKGGGSVTSGTRYSLALLTWGHTDCMVRLKRRRDSPPELLMHVHALDAITTVSTSCMITGCPVFFGHLSGRIAVIRARPEGSSGASAFRPRAVELRAHVAPIVSIYVCAAFSVVVSASRDGRIVVWDLNTLSYVRTIPNREMLAVTSVTASETLCDIASVHDFTSYQMERQSSSDDTEGYEKNGQYKFKSLIRVHTVNGAFVGSVKVVEKVNCVCYSNAPEGISVNCIAVGLDTGAIRLFSSWDLRPVAYIAPVNPGIGLMSITYSVDSQQLFAGRADGAVIAWESGTHTRPGSVRILSAHAIF